MIAKQGGFTAKLQVVLLDIARLESCTTRICFANRLKELIKAGADKALSISATGTE